MQDSPFTNVEKAIDTTSQQFTNFRPEDFQAGAAKIDNLTKLSSPDKLLTQLGILPKLDLSFMGMEDMSGSTKQLEKAEKPKSEKKYGNATEQEFIALKTYKPAESVVPWPEVREVVIKSFHLQGIPASAENVNRFLLMMKNESQSQDSKGRTGANTLAINDWDENARNGTPSKGPCQMVQTTFDAYRDKRLPNNIHGLPSSVNAAMRYIVDTYGYKNKATGELNIPVNGY